MSRRTGGRDRRTLPWRCAGMAGGMMGFGNGLFVKSVLSFYNQPLWKGPSHKTSTYTRDNPWPMLFRDVEPNPTPRIIKAACI